MNKQSVFFDTYNMHCSKLLLFRERETEGEEVMRHCCVCVCVYVQIDDAKMLQNIVSLCLDIL